MRCCGPLEGFQAPRFDPERHAGVDGLRRYDAEVAAFVERLGKELQYLGFPGSLTGKEVDFPVADGYARYVVADAPHSMRLVYMDVGDGYMIPDAHMRGLRRADIVRMLGQTG